MAARILISILVAFIVFLGVKFVLEALIAGIAVYALPLAVLAGLIYFVSSPHLTRR